MKAKNIICLVIFTVILFSFSGCTKDSNVLTIDGENVSIKEFNYFFKTMKMQAEQNIPAEEIEMYWATEMDGKTSFEILKEKAYEEMLSLRIAAKNAQDMGITLNEDVNNLATSFKSQMVKIAPSEQEFYDMTETNSKVIDKISKLLALRSTMLQQLVVDGEIDLSEESFKKTFEDEYFKAQHILFLTQDESNNPLPQDQKDAKRNKAEEILKRVKSGEDFSKLMNEFSEDPGSQSNPDGYVFTTGEMVPEFEEGVKALKLNETSGIIESSYGYHIIKRLPLSTEQDSEEYENAKQKIQNDILYKYLEEKMPEWKSKYNIVENKQAIEKMTL